MQYENEFNKVLPDLKKALHRLSWRLTGYIEDDEIFSRAIETVCVVMSSKRKLQKPEQFITRTFHNAVMNIQGSIIREKKRLDSYLDNFFEKTEKPESKAGSILGDLTGFGDKMTQRVFKSLKSHTGDIKAVVEELGVHEQTVFYHKRKLKEQYKNLKKVYSA